MPTSSPAIHPSRGIHSATTDWNSSDESETSPLNSRMAPDFALPITYVCDSDHRPHSGNLSKLGQMIDRAGKLCDLVVTLITNPRDSMHGASQPLLAFLPPIEVLYGSRKT